MESSSFYDRKEREELYLQLLKLIPKKIKLDAQKILEIGPSDISVKILKREFPNAKYVGLEKQEHFVEKMQREYEEEEKIRAEVDDLLDKINRIGLENLTKQEKKRLDEASRFLRERAKQYQPK